jgi:hypothetical protein
MATQLQPPAGFPADYPFSTADQQSIAQAKADRQARADAAEQAKEAADAHAVAEAKAKATAVPYNASDSTQAQLIALGLVSVVTIDGAEYLRGVKTT